MVGFFFIDYKWPRLLKCKKQHNYVKYDLEHIEETCDKSGLIKGKFIIRA